MAHWQYNIRAATHSTLDDYDDVVVRGHLKEHPTNVEFRLAIVEDAVRTVRAAVEAERATWPRPTWCPRADHLKAVADYAAHACDCDYCLGQSTATDDPDVLVAGTWPSNPAH
ncbi:hypothetical protein CLV63_113220 [Murinocardiopsis flavida]|uniref:Uncharacterized protein n=1 Tax=Murinocardiopsis flavida TaxID=645275 RepID=A0A2P8DFT3_9ACTN|nr:hypothetical protein [Murinocardiopsis flavida]PSK96057.1 hypothetical protein CLV63_113220 [Murinocardiopsis flavida]